MKFFFRCLLHFKTQHVFPVLSIINNYLLKAEEHYYYTLNCWERKKNKEKILFFPENRIRHFMQIVSLETVRIKCQILFYGKNKKNLNYLSIAKIRPKCVSNNSQMSMRKKKCYKIMLFLNNGFIIFFTLFSDNLLTKLFTGNSCK